MMEDEVKEVDEQVDGTEEENQEQEPEEEVQDDTNNDDPDGVDESEDDDGDDEYTDDIEEYLKQFDLPGDPKDLDTALKSGKEAAEELARAKERLAALERGEQVEKKVRSDQPDTQRSESYFKKDRFSTLIDEMTNKGLVNKESADQWKGLSSMNDQVLNPLIDEFEGVLNVLTQSVVRLQKDSRDRSWRSFQNRKLADRDRLDPIMDRLGFTDYDQAFQYLAATDPSLMKKFAEAERKRGANEYKKKKLKPKRFAERRGKGKVSGGKDWEKYMTNGDLDRSKMSSLSQSAQSKIANDFLNFVERKKGK
jgi:hypothetical protein